MYRSSEESMDENFERESTSKDKVSGLGGCGSDGYLKMAAVGRRFALGQLYDVRSDAILSDAWSQQDIRMATQIEAITAEVKLRPFRLDQWSSKLSHAGLSTHLEASVFANLIGKYRGASVYIADQCDVYGFAQQTLRLRYKRRRERLDLSGIDSWPRIVDKIEATGATHVVVGIDYGVEAYSLFSRKLDVGQSQEDVQEEIDELLNRMVQAMEDGLDRDAFRDRLREEMSNADAAIQSSNPREGRLLDAYDWNHRLVSTVDVQSDRSVPLSIRLCPLERLGLGTDPWYGEVEADLVEQCRTVVDQLVRQRSLVRSWLKIDSLKVFQPLRASFREVVDVLDKFQVLFQQGLNKAVPAARSDADAETNAVEKLLEVVSDSHFVQLADDWLEQKRRDVASLETIAKVRGFPLIQIRSQLEQCLFDPSNEYVLVLRLPPLEQDTDPLLESLKSYVTNNRRLSKSRIQKSTDTDATNVPWIRSRNAAEQFLDALRRFKDLADLNRDAGDVAFLVTSLLGRDLVKPSLALYRNGRVIDDNFQTPVEPTNVCVVGIDSGGVVLNWDYGGRPESVDHFTIQYSPSASNPNWSLWRETSSGAKTRCQIGSGVATTGLFRVAAVSKAVHGPFSSPSAPVGSPANLNGAIPVTTDAAIPVPSAVAAVVSSRRKPDAAPGDRRSIRLAESMRYKCRVVGYQSKVTLLAVPLVERPVREPGMRRFVLGHEKNAGRRRRLTLLLVGATGSGKTTLINSMINYIFGVEIDDPFRLVLIKEELAGRSQAHSQTSVVTAYDIHHADGMRIPYSLTLVDTPGYGDTKGLDRDCEITDLIARFFGSPDGIQEIDAVCFVAPASLARLTPTQVYIFDSILSIFGNDIGPNIRLLLTFADNQEPPILSAIVQAGVPVPTDAAGRPDYHKFNNSAFFTTDQSASNVTFLPHMWQMGVKSLESFFAQLANVETKSLTLTRQVLDERKRLEATVEGLEPVIRERLVKLERLEQTKEALDANKAQIDANVDVEFQVEVMVPKKMPVTGGQYLTNCQKCFVTCHFPCGIATDEDKHKCWAMNPNGSCRICPQNCIWNVHLNQDFRWEYVKEAQTQMSQEVRKRYEKLMSKKLSAQDLVCILEKEILELEDQILQMVSTMASCICRLEEIALRPNPFSTPQYIDMMISSERSEKKPGYKARIDSLQKLQSKAQIIDDFRAKGLLPAAALGPESRPNPSRVASNQPDEDQHSASIQKFLDRFS